jgi:hypothetical protein
MCVCSIIYAACKKRAKYCTVICGQSVSSVLPTLSHKRHDFRGGKNLNFWLPLQLLSETFLRDTQIGLHVICPSFLSYFNQIWFSRNIFEKYSNIKFDKNLSCGKRVVPCGRTDTTKLIVAVAILRTRLKMQLLTGIPAAFLQLLHMGGRTDRKMWQI